MPRSGLFRTLMAQNMPLVRGCWVRKRHRVSSLAVPSAVAKGRDFDVKTHACPVQLLEAGLGRQKERTATVTGAEATLRDECLRLLSEWTAEYGHRHPQVDWFVIVWQIGIMVYERDLFSSSLTTPHGCTFLVSCQLRSCT